MLNYSNMADLPPAYREQVARKYMAQGKGDKAKLPDAPAPKGSKYHNKPDVRPNIKFQSLHEGHRYDERMLRLKAGEIRNLKIQPQFTLQESYMTPEGKRIRAIRYIADFSYEELYPDAKKPVGWKFVVEDAKSRPTKTKVYLLKKKLMQERLGIEIREV